MDDELNRIQQRYEERDASQALTGFWTLSNPVVLHLAQERERAAVQALAQAGVRMEGARLLDVGCGFGVEFANYARWGLKADGLFGVDLSHPRLLKARQLGAAALAQASGDRLPFADGVFDVVCQNVVFSSIIDAPMRRSVAAEMLRVLRPGGHVLWYDAARTRGRDPHFVPVGLAEAQDLFPGVGWRWRRVTTDLGLMRRIHRLAGVKGMQAFDLAGLFKTHLLGLGRKAGG